MKSAVHAMLTIGLSLLLTTVGAAQQQPDAKASQQKNQKSGQMMSMEDMTKQCREHCQTTTKSIDNMMKMMNDAKQSNDAAKMRAAIDQTQKPLADMKEHMTKCMDMTAMMQNMGGMKK